MVKETALYDELGVAPDATAEQIRKAYYVKARKVHPDKRPDDPNATREFEALGAAYQVLADPDKRAAYDRLGQAGVSDAPLMDPGTLFSVMFGSDAFEDYVGQLSLASLATIAADAGPGATSADVQAKLSEATERRVADLTDKLRARLASYRGRESEAVFEAEAREEAVRLATFHFGPETLEAVGYVYARAGAKQLGKGLKTLGMAYVWESVRGAGHSAGTTVAAASGAVALSGIAKDVERALKAGELDEAGAERAMQARANEMIAALWKINVLDIEGVLQRVVDRVLREPGLTKSQAQDRARALKRLGRTFQKVAAAAQGKGPPRRLFSFSSKAPFSFAPGAAAAPEAEAKPAA